MVFDIKVEQLILPPDGAFAPFGNACANGLDTRCEHIGFNEVGVIMRQLIESLCFRLLF